MLTLVTNDQGDWIGFYSITGRLVAEGHTLEPHTMLRLLELDHKLISGVDLSETGHLPEMLVDVAKLPGVVTMETIRP